MLTNWKTVSQSIKTLRKIEEQLSDTEVGYNKKEKLVLERERKKLEHGLGGIKNMGGYPDLVFVIDTNKEAIAIAEAKKLNIPIMAILDTNCNPDGIAYPIPGNDDSAKSIKLFCRLISDAAISGTKEHMTASGIDLSRFSDDELPAKIAEIKHAALEKTEKKDKKPKEHVKEEQEQHKHEPREIMHKEHKEEPKEIEAVHHEKSDKKHHDKKEIVKKVEVVTKKASVKKAAEKSEKKPVVKKVTIKKPAEKKKPAAKKKK
jgi:small subunit ribosomal protein S2